MAKPITGLFAPSANKAESKAQQTNSVFRSIVSAEANSREAKTARLRALRLQKEADEPVVEAAPKKRASRAKVAK